MLTELWVRNLALLEELQVAFAPGLNALTGETGAGKSLVVSALDLALGARADKGSVRRGADAAEIIARFALPTPPPALAGVVEDGELLLRRVIGRDGRSRAYVNDRPVTLRALRDTAGHLADLHGQHEQQNILHEETHLAYLDAFAESQDPAAAYREAYRAYRTAADALRAFREEAARSAEEQDLLAFQLDELREAGLRAGEEAELERERHRLGHADRLAGNVEAARALLEDDDESAGARLGKASRLLDQAAALDDALDPLRRQLAEALVGVEETARELAEYQSGLESDPQRLEAVESRLDRVAALKRKHRTDLDGLIARRDDLASRLIGEEESGRRLADLEREVETAGGRLHERAAALTAVRGKAAARFARAVSRELTGLGMAGARFGVDLRAPAHGVDLSVRDKPLGPEGAEVAAFTLAANPGEPAGPLARIASGGEASRVMLALKNVLRLADPVPLVIFDEIDTGIGGLVAEAVGERLASVAGERQVLVVTHLAVIASRAGHHLRLVKTVSGGRTRIEARALSGSEREEELARMLAGRSGGEEARRTARTLLQEDPSS